VRRTEISSTRRRALLDAALGLLQQDGLPGVKARTVADVAGLTTMALYSEFGGLPGLLAGVCEEGYARLDNRLAAVRSSADPVADLFALAIETRAFAIENPNLYDLIFGLPSSNGLRGELGEAGPLPAGGSSYRHTFATLTRACERAIGSGRVSSARPRELAAQLWSLVHGYICLELSGHFGEFEDPVESVLVPLTVSFMTGLGDDREASLAATRRVQAR
jgi:AcrR family transcriptional regulator